MNSQRVVFGLAGRDHGAQRQGHDAARAGGPGSAKRTSTGRPGSNDEPRCRRTPSSPMAAASRNTRRAGARISTGTAMGARRLMTDNHRGTPCELRCPVRFGTLLGGRLNQTLSMNGQMTFDVSHRNDLAGANISEIALDYRVQPARRTCPSASVEVVLGPARLFLMTPAVRRARSRAQRLQRRAQRWRLFVPLGPSSLLGVAAGVQPPRQADVLCIHDREPAPKPRARLNDVDAITLLGVSAALLF